MKKTVFILITLITILLIILLSKSFLPSSTKYSKEEVEQLILKGVENFNDMSNVSFDLKTSEVTCRYYYKGNKMKILYSSTPESSVSSNIINLDERKEYIVSEDLKIITVKDSTKFGLDKGVQYTLARSIENQTNLKNRYKREYHYIKDDTVEGKDCILIEEVFFYKENDTYINRNKSNPEEEIYIYWIEKSTGFVVAFDRTLPNQKTFTPNTIITNITFGNVEDSVFELPTTGYRISEFN